MTNSRDKIWIAGPCAAESREQILQTADKMCNKAAEKGIKLFAFRAGAWKVRSAPDGFIGAGSNALKWLFEVQQTYKIPACVEVVNDKHVELCAENGIKVVWIGARTGVNPSEVQKIADAVKGSDFTVLVKNPIIPDLKLWTGNIERFMKAGVKCVMAVHRGFADATENVFRNAPVWKIPIELKVQMSELPILCDPSHLCGNTKWIPQVAQIAMNYGFDGLMTECHVSPENALSDSKQQLTPEQWVDLISALKIRSENENLKLESYRSLLENIDNQISELLYKRMTLVDEIASVKRDNNIAVVQPQQWQHVVERYKKHPNDALYQNFIDRFLEILHQASIERQK